MDCLLLHALLHKVSFRSGYQAAGAILRDGRNGDHERGHEESCVERAVIVGLLDRISHREGLPSPIVAHCVLQVGYEYHAFPPDPIVMSIAFCMARQYTGSPSSDTGSPMATNIPPADPQGPGLIHVEPGGPAPNDSVFRIEYFPIFTNCSMIPFPPEPQSPNYFVLSVSMNEVGPNNRVLRRPLPDVFPDIRETHQKLCQGLGQEGFTTPVIGSCRILPPTPIETPGRPEVPPRVSVVFLFTDVSTNGSAHYSTAAAYRGNLQKALRDFRAQLKNVLSEDGEPGTIIWAADLCKKARYEWPHTIAVSQQVSNMIREEFKGFRGSWNLLRQ